MDLIVPTHGNGDLCSRLLHNAINRAYVERLEHCCSSVKRRPASSEKEVQKYVEKDGQCVTCYPPLGDGARDAFDAAASNSETPWAISDHDRHTREIQSVGCKLVFAQDHTHEVVKNYFDRKRLGATALWDCSNENGEIASAVLVPTTKTKDFGHAAAALTRRATWAPKAMHSDTWPAKSECWELLVDNLQGRLGLFHYIQRITRTLKKNHVDHYTAINSLLNCIYHCNVEDYENLLRALKEGTLSEKYTDEEIVELRATKVFKQRYDRYLRKEIRPPHVLCSMLDDWFNRFKCTASDPVGSRPADGRRDPITNETLFSADTKDAIKNGKEKASFLQDPLPLHQMHDVIEPSPNSPHGLKEHLSRRGESCLESFHLMLAHFSNCGMRTSLADNLNLTGVARCNLSIRHKLRLTVALTPENTMERRKIPAAFETIVSFFNHSELNYINSMALAAGVKPSDVPFKHVEILPEDNGERFFSEHIVWMNATKPSHDLHGRCLCKLCVTVPAAAPRQSQTQQSLEQHDHGRASHSCHRESQGTGNVEKAVAAKENNGKSQRSLATVRAPEPTTTQPKEQVLAARLQQHHHPHQSMMVAPPPPQQQPMMNYLPMHTPYPPWMMINPFPMAPPTVCGAVCCCGCYRNWHNTAGRRGRPPHDGHCQSIKIPKKRKQTDGAAGWKAI